MFIDRFQYEMELIICCPLPHCNYVWCRKCHEPLSSRYARHDCPDDGDAALRALMLQQGWKACPGACSRDSHGVHCPHLIVFCFFLR